MGVAMWGTETYAYFYIITQYGSAPQYLKDCCTPVADVPGRQHLRSARI